MDSTNAIWLGPLYTAVFLNVYFCYVHNSNMFHRLRLIRARPDVDFFVNYEKLVLYGLIFVVWNAKRTGLWFFFIWRCTIFSFLLLQIFIEGKTKIYVSLRNCLYYWSQMPLLKRSSTSSVSTTTSTSGSTAASWLSARGTKSFFCAKYSSPIKQCCCCCCTNYDVRTVKAAFKAD